MNWVKSLKKSVQEYFANRRKAKENKKKAKESQSALARIRQAGEDRDKSLEEALTPEELARLGYKPKQKKVKK